MDLEELAVLGDAYLADHPTAVDDAVAAVASDHLATLIYTSGTTGKPEGCRCSPTTTGPTGRRSQALKILRPDDIQLPVAAAVALLRQGAGGRRSSPSGSHGRRRRSKDHRQPRASSGRR